MAGHWKILVPSMETILVISCCLLLTRAVPMPQDQNNAEQEWEIKLSSQPLNCKAEENKDTVECQIKYYQDVGFMRKGLNGGSSIVTTAMLEQAIKDFQEFYHLPITGKDDEQTQRLRKADRCSVPDQTDTQTNTKRKKRYAIHGSKWGSTSLTWCIDDSDLTNDMTKEEQKNTIRDAFKMWADVSALTFTEVSDCRRSVIHIKFAIGAHGDNDPFDGKHGTLAHAYFPRFGGDAHFDDAEDWAKDLNTLFQLRGGKLLNPIATHEFGHSLGLSHSRDENAIMYALYFGTNPVTELHPDDIAGIQYLYGRPNNVPTPAPQTPRPPTPRPQTPRPQTPRPQTPRPQTPRPQTPAPPTPAPPTPAPPTPRPPVRALCTDVPNLDAMVMLGDGYTYGFSDTLFWRMDTTRAIDPVPLQVSSNWYYLDSTIGQYRGLAGDFDAVLFVPTSDCSPTCVGNTFFFSGRYVYHTSGTDGTNGFLQRSEIRELFPGLPNDIDAATLWTGNNKMYFFKGSDYWRVSSESQPYFVDQVNWPYNYPRSIDLYWELGWNSIDSAIYYWHRSNSAIKKTYFFKGDQYVRYNDFTGTIDNNYPKFTEVNWYGCRNPSAIQDGETIDEQMMEKEVFTNDDVMEVEVIDIRTAMELPPEDEDDTSSATKISSLGLFLVMLLSFCASMMRL